MRSASRIASPSLMLAMTLARVARSRPSARLRRSRSASARWRSSAARRSPARIRSQRTLTPSSAEGDQRDVHDRVDERPIDDAHQQRRQQHDKSSGSSTRSTHIGGRCGGSTRPVGPAPSRAGRPGRLLRRILLCAAARIDTPACLTCLSARPCYQPIADAVAPGIGAAGQQAALRIDRDAVAAADRRRPVRQHVDLVAPSPQPVQRSRPGSAPRRRPASARTRARAAPRCWPGR